MAKDETLTTSDARARLPQLVKKAKGQRTLEEGVRIGPRGRATAVLVSVEALEAAETKRKDLEEELEDLALFAIVAERAAGASGETISLRQFAEDLGVADELGR